MSMEECPPWILDIELEHVDRACHETYTECLDRNHLLFLQVATWSSVEHKSIVQNLSDYNTSLILAAEARAQRLDHKFASTWQAPPGREIVDAILNHIERAGAIQERLGADLVELTQARAGSEVIRPTQQEQLGHLVETTIHTEALTDPLTPLAA